MLVPMLEKLGSNSLVTSTAAQAVLSRLHSLLQRTGACPPATSDTGPVLALLRTYADYVVGSICFRLKFDAELSITCDDPGTGLPAVLVAVVQNVDLAMVPFLVDVVDTLLHSSPQAHGLQEWGSGTPQWVLRVVAAVVRQLARLICERRLRATNEPHAEPV